MKTLLCFCFLAPIFGLRPSTVTKETDKKHADTVDKRLETLEEDMAHVKNQMKRVLDEIIRLHQEVIRDSSRQRSKRDIPGSQQGTASLGSKGEQIPVSGNTNDAACAAGSLDCPYAMSSKCVICPPGPQGQQGVTGPTGLPGRDGRDGREGSPGPKGDKGDLTLSEGFFQPPQEPTQPSYIKAADLASVIGQNVTGTTYVRWGRTVCPEGAELIYSGYPASGHRDIKGGGSNYLCVTPTTVYDNPNAGIDSSARLYGVEYEVDDYPRLRSQGLDDMEAVCAVCLAPLRGAMIMVPGRNDCSFANSDREWHMEYNGYLMAAGYRYQRTEYVCVDRTPEYVKGSHSNENDATLYVVEGRCSGSSSEGLPCPPYVDGYEITCAVCTS